MIIGPGDFASASFAHRNAHTHTHIRAYTHIPLTFVLHTKFIIRFRWYLEHPSSINVGFGANVHIYINLLLLPIQYPFKTHIHGDAHFRAAQISSASQPNPSTLSGHSLICWLTHSLTRSLCINCCTHTHTHALSKLRLVIVNMFLIRPCSELLHYHIRSEFLLVQTNDQARSVVRIAEHTIRMKMSSVIIFTYIKYCQISNFVF